MAETNWLKVPISGQLISQHFLGRMTGKPTRRKTQLQLLNNMVDKKDYTSVKREAEDRSTWHATNRREMLKTCCLAEN